MPNVRKSQREVAGHMATRATGGERSRESTCISTASIGWSLPETAYGRVFCGRFAPRDYETLRVERMRAALTKKLPKLQSWKDTVRGPCSCWKTATYSLSNHVVILEAAEEALEGPVMRLTRYGWSILPSRRSGPSGA